MKTLQCDLCDFEAHGETFEDWMNALKPHYQEVHAAFMQQKAQLPPEQMKAEMQQWMKTNQQRFEAA